MATSGSDGSGASIFPGTTGTTTLPSTVFTDMAARNALADEHAAIWASYYMARTSVPDTGTSRFIGTAAMGPTGEFNGAPRGGYPGALNAELVARMAMTVDFDKTDMQAVIWDFHNKEGIRPGGSVQMAGAIDFHSLDGSGSGTLNWGNHDEKLDLNLTGTAWGRYGATGTLGGTSTVGSTQTPISGEFALDNELPHNLIYSN
ncbi:MAG: hypothetical protein L0H65_01040 [Pseudorhodobacter sp.]|nr:hypothetical protein [Pseudorhodobacter sp.]